MSNNKRRFFLRYISLIQKLKNKPASFEEIQAHLKRQSRETSEDLSISKRTFQRDLNDILDIFKINIEFENSKGYFISDGGEPGFMTRMLENFDQLDLLYRTKNPSQYIYYERRKPSGTEHFYGILHAIYKRVLISFRHEKFWEDSVTFRTVEPLAIKESQHRWYLIAKDRKDKVIKTFGLDRISEIIIEQEKFEFPNNFDVNEMFENSYGVITDKGKPKEIILSFEPEQRKYLGSLQIHNSQEVIVDNANEYRIKLKMHVTIDLIKEILSYGENVEVITPASLRNNIRGRYKKALHYYS